MLAIVYLGQNHFHDQPDRGDSKSRDNPGVRNDPKHWHNRSGGYDFTRLNSATTRDREHDLTQSTLPAIPTNKISTTSPKQNEDVIRDLNLFAATSTIVRSPTFIGTIGHVIYQSVYSPVLAMAQIVMGMASLINEVREKLLTNPTSKESNPILKWKSDGSWKYFMADLIFSPALQRMSEGVFYGIASIFLFATGNTYVGAIFISGALGSLANAYYMNCDVNYWQNKKLPGLVENILNVSKVLPAFIPNLLSNPGFWACIADSMIAVQGVASAGKIAEVSANLGLSGLFAIGAVCFSLGFAQAIYSSWPHKNASKLILGDKSMATAVAGVGSLSFGALNMSMHNYAIGAAMLLWGVQCFLMTARIEKVEREHSLKDSAK